MFHKEVGSIGRVARRYHSTIANDISTQLNNVPKSTGSGPFIEYPKFEPLGNPASLINVTLPASSILNLRSNSILAANGDLNNINSKLSILKLLTTKPLIYNKISSTSPLSLILSNKGSNKFFINLELSEGETWTLFNTKNLIGWYGPDLTINNNKIGVLLQSGNNKSNVILNGENQLFTLNLESNETIYLNPKSILAINQQSSIDTFHKLHYNSSILSNLTIPSFKFIDSLKISFNSIYRKISQLINTQSKNSDNKVIESPPSSSSSSSSSKSFEIPQSLKSFNTWISTKLNNIWLNDKIFYEVKGPATIIVQNSTKTSTSKIFTNEQLTEMYKNLK